MSGTDATHSPTLRSWVESANAPDTDFPIQNLPFGVFRSGDGQPEIGVAIGDRILRLAACASAGLLKGELLVAAQLATEDALNPLMERGRHFAASLRHALVEILRVENTDAAKKRDELTLPMADATLLMPAHVGDYSDFYASVHHATNVGSMFRPDNPLLPNYKYIPIGYHGRASSIVVSGTTISRPSGQTRDDASAPPVFGPSRRLDYELELGAFVGPGNAQGASIPLSNAEDHLWGVCLVNDWSARDIQAWEYQPLGPFLAKSFATSISPWVVTMDALAPFRVPLAPRPDGDPAPLPYLSHPPHAPAGIDLMLEVWLRTATMRHQGMAPMRVSRGRFADMYWTLAQMLTHHASNGCNLRPGDLIASGTVSGPSKDARGCLLERAWRGTEPVELPTGETRAFLSDGDEVILRGYAEREGFRRIGLGECAGVIAAPPSS